MRFKSIQFVLIAYLLIFVLEVFNVQLLSTFFNKPVEAIHSVVVALGTHPIIAWEKERDPRKGVVTHNPDEAFPGYTLFAERDEPKAFIIDMQGEVIHEWYMPYEKAWPNPTHIGSKVHSDQRIMLRHHLFPNGDLLAMFWGVGAKPEGYGLVKMDKDSNVLWTFNDKAHHDVSVADDGTLFTIVHEIRDKASSSLPTIIPPYWEDYIVHLSSEGEELRRISLFSAFLNSDFYGFLNQIKGIYRPNLTSAGDLFHTNTETIIPQGLNTEFDKLVPGHLLVSIHGFSMLAIVDPEKGVVTWAAFGPWRMQHDPMFLPDGTVLLFDNMGNPGQGGFSRILKVDLETQNILWTYAGTKEKPLESLFQGFVEPLPNGNVLVTESMGGRLLEVTPNKEIVWEYITETRKMYRETKWIPHIYEARRFTADELLFLSE